MQIHVVEPGQSLFSIGNLYGIKWQEIATANELLESGKLAVGQALVIPITGSYYWVKSGDTLYKIARDEGITISELATTNNIPLSAPLTVGQRLYIPPGPKKNIQSMLYVEPRTPVSQVMIQETKKRVDALTYLAMFSYEVKRDGTLKAPTTANLTTIATEAGALNAMVVSNLENFGFSAELAHDIFVSTGVQDLLFKAILDVAQQKGYRDIHFDFELLFPDDRDLYNAFLRRARDKFHPAGLTLSTALAPKVSDVKTGIYGAHDYRAHGEIVDFVALMTYEWGYTYSEPQAVSPLPQVEKVVQYAVQEIPRSKIFLGQNLYGYNWQKPFPTQGGPPAKALSPKQATELAIRENVAISYDPISQAPHFSYFDEKRIQHEVWFEDARSIQAKFDLLKKYGLRGIMYWKLGLAFPQNWLLLEDNFTILKK
ncbi:glycosyl hydrolase family 18 protein [Sporosarcina sp. A2]|uniref:glycosyl hydrolase family 18 protein n=1 Tax=Sporosarcina sp. A2 TaxID=3393449 RepID=UPI003D7AA984